MKRKLIFIFYFNKEFTFIFEEKQNNRYNPILILNEENNLYLSEGTGVEYNNNNYELNSKDNVSEKYTIYTINGLKEYKCKTKPKTI
jgi:lipopolysaccharide export LptBFGC system permease protein LptF